MVSVFIPNFNHAPYLKQRIDSVLNQTFQDFELTIMDDCSTDNSREIIELYRNHPKIKDIIYNQVNSGSVFRQWQKAIDSASGEFMWIAESDDFAKADFLETMVPLLQNEKNAALVYCNAIIVDENGNESLDFRTFSDLRNATIAPAWHASFLQNGKSFLREFLSLQCCINNASAVLFRTTNLKNISHSLDGFSYTGDWAAYINLAFNGDIMYHHDELSYYRTHAKNASKKSHQKNVVNTETYSILSTYYNSLLSAQEKKEYLSKVYDLILPILVASDNRKQIFTQYCEINKELALISLQYIPKTIVNFIARKLRKKSR